jgi:MFS family permease
MTVSAQDSIESRYGWAVAITSTVMIGISFGATYLVVVGLKPIAAEFGWPRQVPSAAYGLALLGAGIGGVAVGFWSDRRGLGLPVLIASVVLGLGIITASQASNMTVFLGAHLLLIGVLGNGAMFSPMVTNVTRWFDRRRGIAVAIVASGQSLAGAVWPPLFRYTVEEYGWRETMLGFGIFAIAALLPLSLVMQRRPPGMLRPINAKPSKTGQRKPPAALVLGYRPNVVQALLCIAIVGCCVAMSMPMVHIVAHCSDLGFDAARGAEMLALLLGCAFISRIAYGWLGDRIGGLTTLLIGSALQLIGLSLFAVVRDLYGLYAVSIFYGIGYGGIVPMYAIIVRELFHEREAGWRIGAIFLFGTIGMGTGGYVGGLIFDLTATYVWAFVTGALFNIGNLVVIATLVWRQNRNQPGPALATA